MGEIELKFGSPLWMQHLSTGLYLVALEAVYKHSGSSGQHALTAHASPDTECDWSVHGPDPEPIDSRQGQSIRDGDIVRLKHVQTGRNLHSHGDRPAPITPGEQEVTTYRNVSEGAGDDNDDWIVRVKCTSTLDLGTRLHLQHRVTKKFLRARVLTQADPIIGNTELSATSTEDESCVWIAQASAVDWPKIEAPREALKLIEDRLSGVQTLFINGEALLQKLRQLAAEAAEHNSNIYRGEQYSVDARGKIEAQIGGFATQLANAEVEAGAIRDLVTQAQEHVGQITSATASAKDSADRAELSSEKIRTFGASLDRLAADLAEHEAKSGTYEAKIKELSDRIESLLPGATSVGLGASFGARKVALEKAGVWWQGSAVAALVLFVACAVAQLGYWQAYRMALDWPLLSSRLFAILPGAWLVIYLSRQSALNKRLQEEYAFKAAISLSFEGYKKQLGEMAKDLPADAPLQQWCLQLLEVISTPPGRIYDKHRLDVSPLTALAESTPRIAKAVKNCAEGALTLTLKK